MIPFWQKKLPQQWKRILLIGVITAGMLSSMLLCSGVTVFTQKVTVDDDGSISSFFSCSSDSEALLAEKGYEIGENDVVVTSKNGSDITITIDRAVTVSLVADGSAQELEVRPDATVADVLSTASVSLGADDVVTADPATPVTDGMQIAVQRISYSDYTVDEPLPYRQVQKETSALYQGETEVQTPGQNGVLTHYYQDTVVDGVVTGTEEVGYNVSTPAVDEVILVGTKPRVTQTPAKGTGKSQLALPASVSLDANGIPTSYTNVITGRGCAYTGGGRTATGKPAAPGYVAVNPNVIPYGTPMYIVSQDGYVYGYAIAADTGGSCMANDILVDLYMNTEQECVDFGSRTVNIYLLG